MNNNMNRRDFLKRTAMATASLSMISGNSWANKTKRPNVLLYVTDDQGTNDAGCYGNSVIKTPGLDQLASEGVRFSHAFCTTASCSPSRSVILSGLHSHANGMYGLSHSFQHFSSFENFKSLPVRLNEAGYRTICAGKYHLTPEPVYHFDQYINVSSPEEMAEKVRSIIAEKSEQPFFIDFSTVEPHRPFWREGSDQVDPADVIVPPYLPPIFIDQKPGRQY